jgi:hypothetical protein
MKIQALVLTVLACALAVWGISRNRGIAGDSPPATTLQAKAGTRHEGRVSGAPDEAAAKARRPGNLNGVAAQDRRSVAPESPSPEPQEAVAEEDPSFRTMVDGTPVVPTPAAPKDQVSSRLPPQERDRLVALLESAAATPETADDQAAMRAVHRARIALPRVDPDAEFSPQQ